jgi:phosphate transport system protein
MVARCGVRTHPGCEDLPRAAEALQGSGHGETARVLAERERVIDALYLEVENLASREVLLQAPVASDLRFLLSVLRVTPELERSHDLVMQVADRTGLAAPGGDLTPRARALAAQMGDLASQMWRQAADAWYSRDRTAAAALTERGQEMDDLHAALAAELATGQATAPVTMETALVALLPAPGRAHRQHRPPRHVPRRTRSAITAVEPAAIARPRALKQIHPANRYTGPAPAPAGPPPCRLGAEGHTGAAPARHGRE